MVLGLQILRAGPASCVAKDKCRTVENDGARRGQEALEIVYRWLKKKALANDIVENDRCEVFSVGVVKVS